MSLPGCGPSFRLSGWRGCDGSLQPTRLGTYLVRKRKGWTGPFADSACDDGAVDQEEIVVAEIFSPRPDDVVSHRHDRSLSLASQPEVAVIQKKIDPVIFFPYGVFLIWIVKNLKIGDGQFHSGRGSVVGSHRTGNLDGCLNPEFFRVFKCFLGDFLLHHDGLYESRSVPNLKEVNLPGTSFVVHPAFDDHTVPDVFGHVLDADT